jgi:predicted porin
MKKLLVIAVAAALAAPAAMADTTLYGKLHASVDNVKTTAGGVSTTDTSVNSNNSRIGIKGSTALDNGMEATYGLEYGIDVDGDGASTTFANNATTASASTLTARNTFVGLKGKFGEVRVGRHDTPAKLATAGLDTFADTAADMSTIITADGERVDNAVAYINKFGPVTVAAAHSTGVIGDFAGGVNLGGANLETNSAVGVGDANTVMAVYGNGPWTASLGHTAINGERSNTNIGIGWKSEAGHNVGLVHETVKTATTAVLGSPDSKDTNLYLAGGYKIGNVMLKAGYGEGKAKYGTTSANFGNNGKEKLTALGADYSFGKKTTAYVLWTEDKNGARLGTGTGKVTTTGVGLVTEF